MLENWSVVVYNIKTEKIHYETHVFWKDVRHIIINFENLTKSIYREVAGDSRKFADDFIENISIAFVYLRNIEFAGEIDFSKFTTDEKIEILKLYMTRDLKDFNIKQLDYTIF